VRFVIRHHHQSTTTTPSFGVCVELAKTKRRPSNPIFFLLFLELQDPYITTTIAMKFLVATAFLAATASAFTSVGPVGNIRQISAAHNNAAYTNAFVPSVLSDS
jgi:hypothetical protein